MHRIGGMGARREWREEAGAAPLLLRLVSGRVHQRRAAGRFAGPLGLMLALLAGAVATTGCERESPGTAAAMPMPAPSVLVTRPVVREVTDWDVYPGRLAATDSVDVQARVSGYLQTAPFKEGSIVQKGDVLFTIDARPYQAELERAQAELASAQARLRLAASEFERISSLRKSGAVSEVEFFNARQALEAAQADVAAAQARVEMARLNVEWCTVQAPITGRVGRKLITPGNFITGPGGQQPPVLTTITSLDPIYCYIEVDERSVRNYQRMIREEGRPSARESRTPAQLALVGESEFRHKGYIDFVDNRVDPATGTLTARGVFPNPTGELLPGFFARLRVPGRGPYEAVLVPEEAVGTNLSQRYVLVVGADDVVRSQTIEPAGLFGDLRAVEGLSPDARVVVSGLAQARAGLKVQPREVPIETVANVPPPASAEEAIPAAARQEGQDAPGPTSGPVSHRGENRRTGGSATRAVSDTGNASGSATGGDGGGAR